MTQNMPQKQKTKLVPVLREPALLTERDADKSPVLECIDLGITFGGLKAVDNFNVTIGRTEISGLIGPNGAGKTTVFNLLTKVYQPTHGTILLNGKDIHDLSTAQVNRAGIARTFQNIRLFGELSVEDYITGFVRTDKASISFNGAWAENLDRKQMYVDILGDKGGARYEYLKGFTFTDGATLESQTPEMESENMYLCEDRAFLESVRTGMKNKSHISEVLETAKLLDAIYRSADIGKEVTLG